MNREEYMHDDTQQDRPSEDIEARTTPGTDPRVEELAREREHADSGTGYEGHGDRYGAGEPTDDPRAQQEGQYGTDHTDPMAGRMAGYRDRFSDLQSRFIDDPKGAVEEAGSLVRQAIDQLMESSRSQHNGDDTEAMRRAMQRYRGILDTLSGSRRG